MKKLSNKKFIRNNSGMLIADFLFAFTMVIGIGMFMFALTFSLATIEVGQYIIWSTARNYSAARYNEDLARSEATDKFKALTDQFPLLTGSGWFELSADVLRIGELDKIDPSLTISADDAKNNFRQPWTGASTTINLKLFANMNVPFLGKVAADTSSFTFPVRAFLIRNVSTNECQDFFYIKSERYEGGIMKLKGGNVAPAAFGITSECTGNGCGEDNGC